LIHAFDTPAIPADLPLKERHRRKLEALRNRALLYALADSGARISEILRLTADDVAGAHLNRQGIWAVEVRGKGRGRYGRQLTLRFTSPTPRQLGRQPKLQLSGCQPGQSKTQYPLAPRSVP